MSFTDSADYDIRYSVLEDGEHLKTWLSNPKDLLWYPPSTQIDMEQFTRNWIGFSRYKASLTAVYKNEVIGVATVFLMPYLKVAHLCMMYMAVSPKHRCKGIGGSLIKNIKHLAKTRFRLESMHIEIWNGCPIYNVARQYGFKELFRQDCYAIIDQESYARIVMETNL